MPESETHYKCSCQSCGGHIEFPKAWMDAAIPCPHCGNSTVLSIPAKCPPSPRRRGTVVWVSVAVMAITGSAIGWYVVPHRNAESAASKKANPLQATSTAPTPAPIVHAAPPDPWHGLAVGPITLQKTESGGLVYAVGVLRNQSDHQRFGVKVELNLFSETDMKVGSATDYTPSIDPGKEWEFRALVTDKTATRAELAKVTEQD